MAFDLHAFHERAVRTPSHEAVGPMRDLLVATVEDEGVDCEIDDAGNVVATRGRGHPHVVLNTHLDTVPPHVPFERSGTTVRGRGACDAKAPLAALLNAFFAVAADEGRVTLAATPDEETRSTGAAALRGRFDADAVVVGEPTGLDVCNAAKGRFEGTVTLTGENAHAAEPDSGVNAVAALEAALAAVRTFDAERGPGPHEALGVPTLTPTVVRGGEAVNQLPDECTLTLDRRSVPPETATGFRDALAAHLRERVPEAVGVDFALTERETPFLEAFATPSSDPLVGRLADAAGGSVRPFTAATEASYFAREAPTVVFGPGVLADESGAVAHSDREYVERPDVERAAAALRSTLAAYVG
ncbi:MAG: M20 family metallopeptidase [Haloarculaceae archaeon]